MKNSPTHRDADASLSRSDLPATQAPFGFRLKGQSFRPLVFVVAAGLILSLGLPLVSVWPVHRHHAEVTIEMEGSPDRPAVSEWVEHLRQQPGVWQVDVGRLSLRGGGTMGRITFQAADPGEASRRIREWLHGAPQGLRAKRRAGTFSEWRIVREGRGDVVFGKPVPIP